MPNVQETKPPTTAEGNPPAEDAPAQDQATDSYNPITINGRVFTLLGTTQKLGPNAGKLLLQLIPEKDAQGVMDFKEFFDNLAQAVGPANWYKMLMAEIVRPMSRDCTIEAIKASPDGTPTDEGYATATIGWFTPRDRRSGPHVKDLRDRSLAIYAELNPLLLRKFAKPEDNLPVLTAGEENTVLRLMAEFSEINAKLTEMSRSGKGKKAKGAKTTEAAKAA